MDENALRELRRAVGKALGRKAPLYRCLSGLIRSLSEYLKPLEQPAALSEKPEGLIKAAGRFVEEARPLLESAGPLGEPVNLAILEALCFNRVGEDFAPERYQVMCGQNKVKLWCYDPSGYLRECLSKVRGSVLFSATFSPLPYFVSVLGGGEGAKTLAVPSPFPRENLRLLLADRVSTKYADREQSLPQVAQLIGAFAGAKTGNYIAYFPSYDYMEKTCELVRQRFPGLRILCQARAMGEGEREEFLASFSGENKETLLGFCVMGGLFSEGVDFSGDRLIGAVIVGVGLPKVCRRQELLREYYEKERGDGFSFAYRFPGMNKVTQAAGRVIRSENDRGAVLLIDARFSQEGYRRLFPPHWPAPLRVRSAAEMEAALRDFWNPSDP